MSFKEALKKLESSKEFKAFKDKHKNAFLFSAFFVLSDKIEAQQFNYFIPDKQEAITFIFDETIKHKTEKFAKKVEKLDKEIKIDLTQLQEIIKKEAEKQKLKIDKIIAILQKAKLKPEKTEQETAQEANQEQEVQIWNITCLCGFNLFRIQIDCSSGEIFKSEQLNLKDLIQIKK